LDFKGYYSILGISENATPDQIKQAYRRAALKYHPDRNKSAIASDSMKRVNEAYEILSDLDKRFQYDNEYKIESKDLARPSQEKPPWWYTWFGDYDEDYESDYQREGGSQTQHTSGYYSATTKRDYNDKRVSIIGQMIGSLIPLINFWIFGRIERLEMVFSCLFPIFIGLIVLMATLPEYPHYFLATYEGRFYLFFILFGASLVFFARKWSIQWNKQIDNGDIPDGDKIDKKVNLVIQMILSVIPFLNFTAFARIYHFIRATVIGIPTYIIMTFVSKWLSQDNPHIFYSAYLALTSVVFMYFMCRWTTRYNSGKCNRWQDTWRDL
jgi:hypothetical protein